MHPILITGATGWLGWHFCNYASKFYKVYGTQNSAPLAANHATPVTLNLLDFDAVRQTVQKIKPDAIFHLAAMSKPNECEVYPEASKKVNIEASLNLAEIAKAYRIPFIFTSTDLVFDGENPPYSESSKTNPICIYGKHKAMAEQKILELYPEATICRMPLMFGPSTPNLKSWFDKMQNDLSNGVESRLFTDEFRTPINCLSASRGLLMTLEKQVQGILHLGGRESTSRYEFGKTLSKLTKSNEELIAPCLQKSIAMPAARAKDASLDNRKAFDLGFSPKSLDQEIQEILDI